jgi:methyl-accepting chemotaxis protein-1 (serine sensor receptor)
MQPARLPRSSATIRSQLLIAFAVVLGLMILGSAAGLRYVHVVHERLERVYGEQLVAIKARAEQRLALHRVERTVRLWETAGDLREKSRLAEVLTRELDAATAFAAPARETAAGPVELKLERALQRALNDYALAVRRQAGMGPALAIAASVQPAPIAELFTQADAKLHELVELNQNNAQTDYEYAKVDRSRVFVWMMGSIAAACAAGLLLAILIVRSIAGRLKEAVTVVERVARGDLTGASAPARNDEIGRLLGSMSGMVEGLIQMLRNVRQTTDALHLATNEAASGSSDLARRTERQALAADELATTARNLAATAQANAASAHQAMDAASEVEQRALLGAEAATRLAECMGAIETVTQRVGAVVHVIDGVAFQTNILALNAAIEAAQAREYGKGFAVVAAEVRALARRAASQAQEIGTLIRDAVEEVEEARSHVTEVRGAIEAISASVRALADAMQHIANASGAQLTSTEQISAAATQAGEDVNRNAALAEQSTAMSEALNDQALRLNQLLGLFKLPAEAVAPSTPTQPARVATSSSAARRPRLISRH